MKNRKNENKKKIHSRYLFATMQYTVHVPVSPDACVRRWNRSKGSGRPDFKRCVYYYYYYYFVSWGIHTFRRRYDADIL